MLIKIYADATNHFTLLALQEEREQNTSENNDLTISFTFEPLDGK